MSSPQNLLSFVSWVFLTRLPTAPHLLHVEGSSAKEEEREQSPVPRLRNDRPKNRSAPPARDDRPACGPHGAPTDPGRTWCRQGQHCPPHSCLLGAPALLLHVGKLRDSTLRTLRVRLMRPRGLRL